MRHRIRESGRPPGWSVGSAQDPGQDPAQLPLVFGTGQSLPPSVLICKWGSQPPPHRKVQASDD